MSKSGPNWAQMEGTFQIAQLIIIIFSVSTYQFNEPKFAKMGFN